MENKNFRPKIKIKRTTADWVTDFIAFSLLVILIAIPIIYSGSLPEKIPTHFNAAGEIDDYGSKSTLWMLPVMGFIMYIGMTILEGFPHIYNYPVEITEENAPIQYRLATRLMRILKTVILFIFSFISYKTIDAAMGKAGGLGKAFLPVFLLITFGTIAIYLARSLNNRYRK
jgi:uncharacterized membrane protein